MCTKSTIEILCFLAHVQQRTAKLVQRLLSSNFFASTLSRRLYGTPDFTQDVEQKCGTIVFSGCRSAATFTLPARTCQVRLAVRRDSR